KKSTIVLFLVLAACSHKRAPSGSHEIRDTTGHTLRVREVKRVISLAPSSTEILYAVGAGPLLVGIDHYSDFPPEARKVEQVGADIDPSLEKILGLKPDLVFTAASANTEATVRSIERLGLPVFFSEVASLEDVYRDVAAIGNAVGKPDEATRL